MTDPQQLRQRLEQLHAELEQVDSVDSDSQELLRDLIKHIQGLLKESDGIPAPQYAPLQDRLTSARLQFQVSHPAVTAAIAQVLETLAQMGI
jgi:hypothetical protein